jgi:ribose transport system substrate-binding protein
MYKMQTAHVVLGHMDYLLWSAAESSVFLMSSGALHCYMAALVLVIFTGCRSAGPPTIAVIPRTTGTLLWEPEHRGAQVVASKLGLRIYWNASTREDDVDGQIALVERVTTGNYKGIVLAPDHSLALITPVRRALASGLTTVIVSSPLPIPADPRLYSILNDEEEGGRLAAERIARLTGGQGSVAMIGINPDIAGIIARANSVEKHLAAEYPDIHIVVRRAGSFNVAHEQQGAREMIKQYPGLNLIVALTSTSTHGAISAIESNTPPNTPARPIRVIGFDPDSLLFESPALDSFILQDTKGMGEQAIRLIDASLHGQTVPQLLQLKPIMVTRENKDSARVLQMIDAAWRPDSLHLLASDRR